MTDDAFRGLIEEHWAALETERSSGEHRLRVSQLPVATEQGPLRAAVDHDGYRHVLIPIHTNQKIRSGLDGPVLHLRRRPLEDEESYQTYADLACMRTDLNDLFTGLCVDVLSAAEKLPANPVKALYHVLDRWKALFQAHGTPLGPEQVAGLFGELLVLAGLLRLDSSAHRLWRGPEGHHHDFMAGDTAIEVKTTIAAGNRRIRIHGLDQLDPPNGGQLYLAWFRLERAVGSDSGLGLPELLERVLRLCDDESALLTLLAKSGYRAVDAERYRGMRFVVDEERWYEVSSDFPRLTARALTAAGIPVLVSDVEYTIDMSRDTPMRLSPDEVTQMFDLVIRESA